MECFVAFLKVFFKKATMAFVMEFLDPFER